MLHNLLFCPDFAFPFVSKHCIAFPRFLFSLSFYFPLFIITIPIVIVMISSSSNRHYYFSFLQCKWKACMAWWLNWWNEEWKLNWVNVKQKWNEIWKPTLPLHSHSFFHNEGMNRLEYYYYVHRYDYYYYDYDYYWMPDYGRHTPAWLSRFCSSLHCCYSYHFTHSDSSLEWLRIESHSIHSFHCHCHHRHPISFQFTIQYYCKSEKEGERRKWWRGVLWWLCY